MDETDNSFGFVQQNKTKQTATVFVLVDYFGTPRLLRGRFITLTVCTNCPEPTHGAIALFYVESCMLFEYSSIPPLQSLSALLILSFSRW